MQLPPRFASGCSTVLYNIKFTLKIREISLVQSLLIVLPQGLKSWEDYSEV